jgi:hypothetical protein
MHGQQRSCSWQQGEEAVLTVSVGLVVLMLGLMQGERSNYRHHPKETALAVASAPVPVQMRLLMRAPLPLPAPLIWMPGRKVMEPLPSFRQPMYVLLVLKINCVLEERYWSPRFVA